LANERAWAHTPNSDPQRYCSPVRAAFDGVVMVVNEALIDRPIVANNACYGEGWMMLVRPRSDNWQSRLVTGAPVGSASQAWVKANAFLAVPAREGARSVLSSGR
jgi:hypothetical protein